ncbi:ankyrin repeat-containing domain protein [Xylogone sp. PMI_703]|nr:ankyrin repeat-containing domain protein [Xylogone sp. PMI_703]
MEEPSKFAIHEAAREGKCNVVESLLNANPKLANRRDDDERLPIHWAVSNGHLDIAVLLSSVKDFDPDVEDGVGWTPLMMAVSLKDREDLVDLFLQKGADVNAKIYESIQYLTIDRSQQSTSKNNLDAARKLLAHNPKASTRQKDRRGQYPIHRAAAVGSVPMVELLLKNNSPLNATDNAGQTPLHHAVAEGHGDTAVALLKAGAETDKKDVDGYLALDLAPDKQVLKFIKQSAEREGIELESS